MKHLTSADYRLLPWANGRGKTLELLREDAPEGLRLRLSIASVTEDGPFSNFPGIERNLTVISGPGFRLEGVVTLECRPMMPVAFPGDVAVRAAGTGGVSSEDFNVMTARALGRPEVTVLTGTATVPAGGTLYLMPLAGAAVNGVALAPRDLVVLDGPAHVSTAGPVIAVRLNPPS